MGPKGPALHSLQLLPSPCLTVRKGYPHPGNSCDPQGGELEVIEQQVRPDQLGSKGTIFPLNTVVHAVSVDATRRSGKLSSASVVEPGTGPGG